VSTNQPVPEDPSLTFEYIMFQARKAYPGVQIEKGEQVGGRQLRFWVWQFLIEVSFQENKISFVDKAGSARVTFKFQPDPKKPPVFTKTTTVKSVSGFDQFIAWTVSHINGIVAAITMAMEEAPPPPMADIFSGDDSR